VQYSISTAVGGCVYGGVTRGLHVAAFSLITVALNRLPSAINRISRRAYTRPSRHSPFVRPHLHVAHCTSYSVTVAEPTHHASLALNRGQLYRTFTPDIGPSHLALVHRTSSSFNLSGKKHQVISKILTTQTGQPGIEECTYSCPKIKYKHTLI